MARSYPPGVEAATVARSVRTKIGRRSTDALAFGLERDEDMKTLVLTIHKGLQSLERRLIRFEREHGLVGH